MIRAITFWSAVVGYLLLATMIVAGGAAWPGYAHTSQFISELGATGAPHGRLVSLGGFLPVGVCLTLFALLAAYMAPRSGLRLAGFACLALFSLGYIGAAAFPCDLGCRPETPSYSQVMHNLFGLGGYLGGPIGLVLLGIAARRWPGATWLGPLGLVCGAVALLAFMLMLAEPPYGGLVQRMLEGSVAIWTLAFAFTIRSAPPVA
jgi:hypothetical membrane protein